MGGASGPPTPAIGPPTPDIAAWWYICASWKYCAAAWAWPPCIAGSAAPACSGMPAPGIAESAAGTGAACWPLNWCTKCASTTSSGLAAACAAAGRRLRRARQRRQFRRAAGARGPRPAGGGRRHKRLGAALRRSRARARAGARRSAGRGRRRLQLPGGGVLAVYRACGRAVRHQRRRRRRIVCGRRRSGGGGRLSLGASCRRLVLGLAAPLGRAARPTPLRTRRSAARRARSAVHVRDVCPRGCCRRSPCPLCCRGLPCGRRAASGRPRPPGLPAWTCPASLCMVKACM